MEKINILTVDDNAIMADGLMQLFQTCSTINYRGNVKSPEACLERLKHDTDIDLLLIDVKFPKSKMDGIQLAHEIRKRYPYNSAGTGICRTKIAFFSVESLGFVDRTMGICGIIPKEIKFEKIVSMIELIIEVGAIYEPQSRVSAMPSFWNELTAKQKKVFCFVIQGNSTDTIVDLMKPSVQELEQNFQAILKKVNQVEDPKINSLDNSKWLTKVLKEQDALTYWRSFSKREQEILKLKKEKKNIQEIADAFKPTKNTIITHRRNIMKKIKQDFPYILKIDDPHLIIKAKELNLCAYLGIPQKITYPIYFRTS